jgi:hypothetical protein
MRSQAHQKLLLVVVGLLGILVAGCGSLPAGRFETLASAGHNLSQGTTDTYTRIEKLQRRYMVFNPAPGELTVDSFKPVIDGRDFDLTSRLSFRESALNVLVTYVDALVAFVKKDYQSGLDKATQELGSSVANLVGHVASSDEAKQAGGILATAVNGLGHALIEAERTKAVKNAMTTAQTGVATLATVIARDDERIKEAVVIMGKGIVRSANRMRPSAGSRERLSFDDEVSGVIAESIEIQSSLATLSKAATAFPKAHAEIRDSLDHPRSPLEQLQALAAEAKRLNTFYRSQK